MRDAWRYLLNTVNDPLTLDYLCKLNGLIARNEALEWGKLRTGTVGISGTGYIPPVPSEASAQRALHDIMNSNSTHCSLHTTAQETETI